MPHMETQRPHYEFQAPLPVTPAGPPHPMATPAFYVVSPGKLALLFFATFGFYGLYWFWRHWTLYRQDRNAFNIWPVPRAVFSIFFAHSLNHEIDQALKRAGVAHAWSPAAWATLYVTAVILSYTAGNYVPDMHMSPGLQLGLTVLFLIGQFIALLHTQLAANAAAGDPTAMQNHQLTGTNKAWLMLGAMLWLTQLLPLIIGKPITFELSSLPLPGWLPDWLPR